jgi:hypothetical protein
MPVAIDAEDGVAEYGADVLLVPILQAIARRSSGVMAAIADVFITRNRHEQA